MHDTLPVLAFFRNYIASRAFANDNMFFLFAILVHHMACRLLGSCICRLEHGGTRCRETTLSLQMREDLAIKTMDVSR